MRPARRSFPRAPFVAHVIAECEAATADARDAVRAYAAADALGFELPQMVVASL